MAMPHHYQSPCIHCGVEMEHVGVGPCPGDTSKAIPIAYATLGTRWDGVEHYRIRYSDGRIEDRHEHVSMRAPYYHFGHSDDITQPPRYDARLRHQAN